MKTEYIVGIGEILWDMLPEGRRLGGAPTNFAYHVSQFGLKSLAVSAVGRDEAGDAAIQEMNSLTMLSRVDCPTGMVDIRLDSSGIPQYDIRIPAAWDNIPFTPELKQLAYRTRAVCFGTLARRSPVSRHTISAFLEALEQCNILKINDEELSIISGMLSVPGATIQEKCRQILLRFKLKFLILTCGVNGSYVFSSLTETPSFLSTPHVTVADTVGAGDSFTAAFIAALIHGRSPLEAHRLAVDVSAYVCTRNGAMPELPDTLCKL